MKKVVAVLLCLILLSGLTACTATPSTQNEKLVVTSFYPIYVFTQNLLQNIDGVDVVNMTENHTGCLHDYQLMPSDMQSLEKAQAFIINGADMEEFLEEIAKSIPSLTTIDSSTGIDLLLNDEDETHDHSDDEEHGVHNPHIWMNVLNAVKQVENIARGLIETFPEHAQQITKNKEQYSKRLHALHAELSEKLLPLASTPILSFHKAYDYFAEEFSLIVTESIENDDYSQPSAKRLAELARMIETGGVRAIFIEPDYAGSSAKILARETTAKLFTLDPITSGDGSLESYENSMQRNAETLLEALT